MQKTAYELRISDWSSDVCSSDLRCRSLVSLPLLGGGLGRGASTFYRPADHCRHAFQILHHLGIGKPKHMIASRFKPSRTPQIVIHLCRVGITIYFYGKPRSEEHTSELQSLMRISYAVFCLKKNKWQSSILCSVAKRYEEQMT